MYCLPSKILIPDIFYTICLDIYGAFINSVPTGQYRIQTMTKGIQTKQAVIERITEHIHCYGFSNTSLHDIIAISGVKKGNLYFHFKNKEALVLEVLQSAFNNHQQYIAKHTSLYSNPIQKILPCLIAVLHTMHNEHFWVGAYLAIRLLRWRIKILHLNSLLLMSSINGHSGLQHNLILPKNRDY
jgi:AcrR family transcriptional regulator